MQSMEYMKFTGTKLSVICTTDSSILCKLADQQIDGLLRYENNKTLQLLVRNRSDPKSLSTKSTIPVFETVFLSYILDILHVS